MVNTALSQGALSYLKAREGVRNVIYQDVVGLDTIGVGHLIRKPHDISLEEVTGISDTQKIISLTDAEVDELLELDLANYEANILKKVKVTITQEMYDALVVFSFNIGIHAFNESTLLKLVNDKKFKQAADEFLKWRFAGGKIVKGLVIFRHVERLIFKYPENDLNLYSSLLGESQMKRINDLLKIYITPKIN